MNVPVKIKKRITPQNLTIAAALAKEIPEEEEEDKGPLGPRRRPPKKVAGARLKEAFAIIKKPSTKIEHTNPWVHHVKLFAKINDLPYGCALSNPNIRKGYEIGQYTFRRAIKPLKAAVEIKQVKEPKKRKSRNEEEEASEAAKHEKFLNKIGSGTHEAVKIKQKGRFDALFNKYDKAFTKAEDEQTIKDTYKNSELERKKTAKKLKLKK